MHESGFYWKELYNLQKTCLSNVSALYFKMRIQILMQYMRKKIRNGFNFFMQHNTGILVLLEGILQFTTQYSSILVLLESIFYTFFSSKFPLALQASSLLVRVPIDSLIIWFIDNVLLLLKIFIITIMGIIIIIK